MNPSIMKRLVQCGTLTVLFILAASPVFVNAITAPAWMGVGVTAIYTWREYNEGMATPVTTTMTWSVQGTFEDPFDPYCMVTRTILGVLADVLQVYYANGFWMCWLPSTAFQGAMTETISVQGYGNVECYRLPQSFGGMGGNAYYDKTSHVLMAADLAAGSDYLRIMITSGQGLINVQGGGLPPTPKYTLAVISDHGTPSGGGTFDSGTTVYATVSPSTVSSSLIQDWVFTGWSGDASGTGTTSNAITMTSNKTAIATWTLKYNTTFYILIAVVAVAVVGLIIFLVKR